MVNKRFLTAGVVVLALVSAGGTASAQGSGSDDWEFLLAPYLWASGLDGDVTTKGVPAAVDLEFGDILDVLDGGGLVHFEAGKGRWTVLADAIYLDLGQDFVAVPGEADVEQAILETAGGYQVAENVDWLFGVRYTSVDTELRFQGPLGTVKDDQGWLDPVIGARWVYYTPSGGSLYFRGDVGGFGVGSDLTWQFRAGALFQVSKRISVGIGYRLLAYDYEDGAGLTQFKYDVRLSGLEVPVGFRF